MKKIPVLFLAVFFTVSAFTQVHIVPAKHDSINCRVTKVDQDYIYYSVENNGVARDFMIPFTGAKACLYNFHFKNIPVEQTDSNPVIRPVK